MLLTNVVIAAGALVVGGKAYVEKQRKKKTPWSAYARKIEGKRKKGLAEAAKNVAQKSQETAAEFAQMPLAVVDTAKNVAQKSQETAAEFAIELGYVRRYWRPYWGQGALAVGCLLSYQGVRMVGAYALKTVVDGVIVTQAFNPLSMPLLGALAVGFPVGVWRYSC